MLSSTPHFTPYSPAMIYSWWVRGSSCIDRWGLRAKTMRDVTPHQENLRLLMRREKVQCKQHGMRAAWRCAIALASPPHLHCLHCISVGIGREKKNVYDRTSRVVSANVQREDKMRLLQRFADADNLPTSSSMK